MSFSQLLEQKRLLAEKIINKYLPKEEGLQKTVIEAMNYSMVSGGKRIRPMLMSETYKLFGGNGEVIEPFMAAMEMIHTYSLVHDDLPAMDDDDYRRGRKTTHVVYGEAIGILAGDGLLNYAFETATEGFLLDKDSSKIGWALKILSAKSGIHGMIGGQTVDVESVNQPLTEEKLNFIFRLKTAALIEGSMMVGAILAGATEEEISIVEQAGCDIGVAFQIQDDILDVTSTLEVLGKPVLSDEKNNKVTYVTLKGLDKAKDDVKTLSDRAIRSLASLHLQSDFLIALIEHLINREK